MNRDRRREAVQMKRHGESGLLGRIAGEAEEPAVFSEEELLAADVERDTDKAEKAHARNDADAMSLQVQYMREHGAL